MDYLGMNTCLFIFATFFTAGYLTTLGEAYIFLVIGRCLYGLGLQCVSSKLVLCFVVCVCVCV